MNANGFYEHIQPAYYIATGDFAPPAAINFILLFGTKRENIIVSPLDIGAHNFYINPIAACGDMPVLQIALNNAKVLIPVLKNLQLQFPELAPFIGFLLGPLMLADLSAVLPPGSIAPNILAGDFTIAELTG